jgi:hypothetical protein
MTPTDPALRALDEHEWRYKHGTTHAIGCCLHGALAAAEAAPLDVEKAARRLIDYLDVREHYEDDTGIRRVDAASQPYVSDLRAALAATSREASDD